MKFGFKNTPSKEILIIKITCLSWLVAKGISWKLWLADRVFPIISPFNFSPNLPKEAHLVLLFVSIFGLLLILFYTPKKEFLYIVLLAEIASCSLDQMRWQPWEYHYLWLFVFFVVYKKGTNQFLELLTFLIGITYVYSGLHKFNGGFLYSIWEQMILKNYFHFQKATFSTLWVHYSGLLLPIIETAIGLSLLLNKKKRLTAYFAIGMHVLLLLLLVGNNQNSVVWPWNISMLICVWMLFLDENEIQITRSFFKNNFNLVIVFAIGVLPFFCFLGLWDNYLSFNLYSGNVKQLIICIKDPEKYPELQSFVSKKQNSFYCQDYKVINANNWAFKEMNVPLYPQEKTFFKFKKAWNISFPDTENTFISYWYPYKKENNIEIP